jgi:hypothetical protein
MSSFYSLFLTKDAIFYFITIYFPIFMKFNLVIKKEACGICSVLLGT